MDAKKSFDVAISQVKSNASMIFSLNQLSSSYIDFSDLYRSQIVLCVSALDYYIHERVRQSMLAISEGVRIAPKKYFSFQITMSDSLGHVNSSDASWLDTVIRTKHSWQSFQDPDKIRDVIAYIYEGHLWQEVAVSLGEDRAKIIAELKLIIDRRNKIAHEADFDPSMPGSRWPIAKEDVEKAIDFIDKLVAAIESVVK